MGRERSGQLFPGWDRLKYGSVLSRQKWKTRISLAVVGDRNQSLPSGKGGVWGTWGTKGMGLGLLPPGRAQDRKQGELGQSMDRP